jgi:hypothetical protein
MSTIEVCARTIALGRPGRLDGVEVRLMGSAADDDDDGDFLQRSADAVRTRGGDGVGAGAVAW